MTGRRDLHAALWRYDRAYRAAWFVGPAALVVLAAGAIFGLLPRGDMAPGQWVKAPPAPVQWGACSTAGIPADIIEGCTGVIAQPGIAPLDAANAYFRRGLAHNRLNEAGPAIEDYTQALRLAPSLDGALNNRGVVYQEQGRTADADADFTAAIAVNPQSAIAYANRAELRRSLGRLDDAQTDVDTAIRLNPQAAKAFWIRAQIAAARKSWEPAAADATQAIALGFTPVQLPLLIRANAYLQERKPDLALADATRCLQVDPHLAACAALRDRIQRAGAPPAPALDPNPVAASRMPGDAQPKPAAESAGDPGQAAARAPQSASILAAHAITYWQELQAACRQDGRVIDHCEAAQDIARARRYFDDALASDGNDVAALVGRGSVELAAGQRDQAEADWRRALRLAPGNPDAKAALAQAGMPTP